ncbi:hypothetical protein KIN20_028004 [Parelaphostrongylus tenuis]|uniref:Uncharacterized protein n=1 Tax=Parelaphostrongylus tenuis TaxID=148309 RepID=A0AAD5R0E7_PARTN|nr:hypothetical protein KIN20_028004 [Parelaphostrongylus tenuis]
MPLSYAKIGAIFGGARCQELGNGSCVADKSKLGVFYDNLKEASGSEKFSYNFIMDSAMSDWEQPSKMNIGKNINNGRAEQDGSVGVGGRPAEGHSTP